MTAKEAVVIASSLTQWIFEDAALQIIKHLCGLGDKLLITGKHYYLTKEVLKKIIFKQNCIEQLMDILKTSEDSLYKNQCFDVLCELINPKTFNETIEFIKRYAIGWGGEHLKRCLTIGFMKLLIEKQGYLAAKGFLDANEIQERPQIAFCILDSHAFRTLSTADKISHISQYAQELLENRDPIRLNVALYISFNCE